MQIKMLAVSLTAMTMLCSCKIAQTDSARSAADIQTPAAQDFSREQDSSSPTISDSKRDDIMPPAETAASQAHTSVTQAQTDLADAQSAAANQGYIQAFKLAVQSYTANPTPQAEAVAIYAASQVTPVELVRMNAQAQTHFEQAVLGQLRINMCAAQGDKSCVSGLVPKTAESLRKIGKSEAADRLTALGSASNRTPRAAVLLPLSGNDRKIGRAMLGAFIQASGVYDRNALPFDLRFFDTKSNPAAIPALMDEIENFGAQLVIGPIDIRESQAAVSKLGDRVLIGFSPNDAFTHQSASAFQFSYDLIQETQHAAQVLVAGNIKNAVTVAPDDGYAKTTAAQLRSALPQAIRTAEKFYPPKSADLRTLAKETANIHPDAIFLPTSAAEADRIMSFMAGENIWCADPSKPRQTAKSDTRNFVTCISTGVWSPLPNNKHFKFISDAVYFDYADTAAEFNTSFTQQFEQLYHRQPAVHEVLPYLLISLLRPIAPEDFASSQTLTARIYSRLNGQKYLVPPSARRVTASGSEPYKPASASHAAPLRTLISK